MRKKALICTPSAEIQHDVYGPDQLEAVRSRVDVVAEPLSAEAIRKDLSVLSEVEVLFGTWGMPELDAELLAAAPRLEAVFYAAGSVKGFTTEESFARGVRIFSAWGANAVPVAEFTFAQIILSLKSFWNLTTVAGDTITLHEQGLAGRVAGGYRSTVGLLSLGQIGRMVARFLASMDVQVIAYDPFCSAEKARELGVELCSLEAVFERGDVVSCHTPWLPETVKMLSEEHFARMRRGATFINTARGAVVDEDGLIAVLRKRPDLNALLDVTHPEPPAQDSPLRILRNVVLSPHIAGSLALERRRLADFMLEEFDRVYGGDQPQWEVSAELAKTLA